MPFFLYFFASLLSYQLLGTLEAPITFAAIGDFGNDSHDESAVAALIKRNAPDFVITMGDNNYPNGCKDTIDKNVGKYFHTYIRNYGGDFGAGSLTQRFFPTLGNHDWRALEKCHEQQSLPYFLYFDLPGNERYYDFVQGPVHFFALDSDPHEPDGNKKFSRQYEWFKAKLASSTAAFNLVFFHHSPFSSGEHGNFTDMQWDFAELGADLVLTGHDHSYERIQRSGLTYIVNGLGGAELYRIEAPIEGSIKHYDKKHGALFIEADETKMHIRLVNDENELIDELIIPSKDKQCLLDKAFNPKP